jgi:hemoglobin-like flavoprotein
VHRRSLDDVHLHGAVISEKTSYAGVQHARFGAKPADFSAFGEALLWCLEQQFGSTFTPELRAAWATPYNAVQKKMISAAERAA